MKYLLLVATLLAGICVVDTLVPDSPCCPSPVVPQYASMSTINPGNLKSSCQCAPLFVENKVPAEETVPTVRRSIWYPGKNIIRSIKNRRHRDVVYEYDVK